MKIASLLAVLLLTCGRAGVTLWGQDEGPSLGDLARQERERRNALANSKTVITNEEIGPGVTDFGAPAGSIKKAPLTIPRQTSGLLECAEDVACFVQSFDKGQPAALRRRRTTTWPGIKYADTAFMEASNFTPQKTTFYLKLDNRSVEFDEGFQKEALQAGASAKEIEDMKRHITADIMPQAALEQACIFQRSVLKDLFQSWSGNGFLFGGFDKAEKCEVSISGTEVSGAAEGGSSPAAYATDLWCALNLEKEQSETVVRACEGALLAEPASFSRLNNLAWFYATAKDSRLRDAAKALDYAQRAVALTHEKIPELLDTLAEAYFMNGDYDRAIETERKVLALSPKNASFQQSLEKYQRAKNAKR